MNSLLSKYKPAIILTLALAVFLTSCKLPTTTPDRSWVVSTFAGAVAKFNGPHGVAVDSSGNLYVADRHNHRIRKITSAGELSTFAGSKQGDKNGTGTRAQFNNPTGVAVDSSGNLYVADTGNYLIRKITPGGVVSTLAGTGTAGSADTNAATGTRAQFNNPTGVAVDSSGNVYVADESTHRIRKITPAGVVSTLLARQFNWPTGVAVDSSGNVYVGDTWTHTIRKITPGRVVTTIAGTGSGGDYDGTGTAAQFTYPEGVAVDSSGILYVADTDNHTIRKIE